MYLPIFTDYYRWITASRYWFSDTGTGGWSYLGAGLGFITGLVVAPIKTLIDMLAFGYQKTAIGLRNFGIAIVKAAGHGNPDFDLRKNHFIGNWFMPIKTVFTFLLWIPLLPLLPIAGIIYAVWKKIEAAERKDTIARHGLTPQNYTDTYGPEEGSFIGLVNKVTGFISTIPAGILSFAITVALYIPHKIIDSLAYLWSKGSTAFDSHVRLCRAGQDIDGDPKNHPLMPKTFDREATIIRFMMGKGISGEGVPNWLEKDTINSKHADALKIMINNKGLFKTFNQTKLSERKLMLKAYDYARHLSALETFGNEADKLEAYRDFLNYDAAYDDPVARHHFLRSAKGHDLELEITIHMPNQYELNTPTDIPLFLEQRSFGWDSQATRTRTAVTKALQNAEKANTLTTADNTAIDQYKETNPAPPPNSTPSPN